jgi:hypothetical protein
LLPEDDAFGRTSNSRNDYHHGASSQRNNYQLPNAPPSDELVLLGLHDAYRLSGLDKLSRSPTPLRTEHRGSSDSFLFSSISSCGPSVSPDAVSQTSQAHEAVHDGPRRDTVSPSQSAASDRSSTSQPSPAVFPNLLLPRKPSQTVVEPDLAAALLTPEEPAPQRSLPQQYATSTRTSPREITTSITTPANHKPNHTATVAAAMAAVPPRPSAEAAPAPAPGRRCYRSRRPQRSDLQTRTERAPFRESNRKAAIRSRAKKKVWMNEMSSRMGSLQERYKRQRGERDGLQAEIQQLKSLLLIHSRSCDKEDIGVWFTGEESRVVRRGDVSGLPNGPGKSQTSCFSVPNSKFVLRIGTRYQTTDCAPRYLD